MNKIKIWILILIIFLSNICCIIKDYDGITDEKKVNTSSKIKNGKYQYSENITIYFTQPPYNTEIEKDIIKLIKEHNADFTMDICIYGLDNENIIRALESSIKKGIHVRFIGNLDGDSPLYMCRGDYYQGYKRIADALDKYFPIIGKKRVNFPDEADFDDFKLINKNGIMHNKFMLLTDKDCNNYIFTGSANYTETCLSKNNNNTLLLKNKEVYDFYKDNFDKLLNDSKITDNKQDKDFSIDGVKFKIIFSAGNDITLSDFIINKMNNTMESIDFLIYSFSHEEIMRLLCNLKEKNIVIMGIFDKSQLDYSREEYLVGNDIQCKIDGNNHVLADKTHGGKLHHKIMIIDKKTVITGSFNWSDNADYNNHENLIIIDSEEIAKIFSYEFKQRWAEGILIKKTAYGDKGDYQDIIINEIMWMGSRKYENYQVYNDEFIELKNLTDRDINLNGWQVVGAGKNNLPLILDNINIKKNSFLLIKTLQNTDSAFIPDNVYLDNNLSIPNNKLEIILLDPFNNIIDYAGDGNVCADFGGYNDNSKNGMKKSLSRKNDYGDGRIKNNWFTSYTQSNINSTCQYQLFNYATPCVNNYAGSKNYKPLSVIISEIAWAGTDISYADEWFELYNNTDFDINLAGWSIQGDINIHLSGIIKSKDYYLLERSNDDSVKGITADKIYTGSFKNTGGNLSVCYGNQPIDIINLNPWPAGSSNPKITMDRINYIIEGNKNNWQNGKGDIEGAKN